MQPMKNTTVLAFSFFAVFTAFQGIQNIASSINQDKGLGVASLSCIYSSCIVTAMLSPLYIHSVGLKPSFILAFIAHCLYCLSNFHPAWWTLIPSSVLLGLTLSPMWIARHLYVTAMGTQDIQGKQEGIHGSLSKHNGIFFACFSLAQVTGNFLSSAILHQSSADQTDLKQAKICGADDCPGIENKTTEIIRPDTSVVNLLLGIYLACQLVGLGAAMLFLRPLKLEGSDQKSPIKKSLSCCVVLKQKKLLLLIPLKLSQAVHTSIMFTGFTKAYVSCSAGVKMVGFVMMTYGLVSSICAVTFGHAAKYTGRKPLMGITLGTDVITLLSLLLWKPISGETYLLLIIPSIWAVGDGIWKSQIMSLVAVAFSGGHQQLAGFSSIVAMGDIGFTFVLITDRMMCLRIKLYVAIFLWTAALVSYIVLEVVLITESKDNVSAHHGVTVAAGDDVTLRLPHCRQQSVKVQSS
ncbi:protein unc-93 homolog A-like [Haliotis rufescens]|uniref:protein unc-93 homolog A-like n=1 Tax=Haliotis rufescens TaxID=6454 RepID=UPI00201EC031|nr:protein unc-93 homolog A-like [Haliotis rufescens]